MKKRYLILTAFIITSVSSFAQISDRINDASTYNFGARPEAGNFGYYLALSSNDIIDLAEASTTEDIAALGIPLINVKYYASDKLVYKFGAQIWSKKRSIVGEIDTTAFPGQGFGSIFENKEVDARFNFLLGAERHFDVSNLIDGYIGLQSSLGYVRTVTETAYGTDFTSDFFSDKGSSFGLTYALEAFVGSNLFIADLPIAFGVELGVSARNYGDTKFKYEYQENIGNVQNSGEYFTSNISDFENSIANNVSNNVRFSKLKTRSFDVLPLARLTLSYYFK